MIKIIKFVFPMYNENANRTQTSYSNIVLPSFGLCSLYPITGVNAAIHHINRNQTISPSSLDLVTLIWVGENLNVIKV